MSVLRSGGGCLFNITYPCVDALDDLFTCAFLLFHFSLLSDAEAFFVVCLFFLCNAIRTSFLKSDLPCLNEG